MLVIIPWLGCGLSARPMPPALGLRVGLNESEWISPRSIQRKFRGKMWNTAFRYLAKIGCFLRIGYHGIGGFEFPRASAEQQDRVNHRQNRWSAPAHVACRIKSHEYI